MALASDIDIRTVAEKVVATLDSLESYLTTVMNPNRVALADLGMEPMGWTTRAYSPRAFEIWSKQQTLDPNDHLTLHHLAIMHHARGFDREKGRDPAEADADWQAAMDYWHRLHRCDAFWDDLAFKACAGATNRKDVDALRAQLPALLLGIHYDIALDDETRTKRKSRTKFHLTLAQGAPFDAPDRDAARTAAYAKFIRVIPDQVWQRNELREEEVAKGTKVIEEFLLFDPGCQPALEDALRLQRRMQHARNLRWRSLDEKDPERIRVLEAEQRDHRHWHPYFKQLVERRDELEESVRENVAGWYFTCGDSLGAFDRGEDAAACFEMAVQACGDDDDRKRFTQRLVQSLALVAQHKAANRSGDTRRYCDRVRARNDLTVVACLLLARAYLVLFTKEEDDDLKLLDVADELCRRGLAIEPDFDELDADECKEHFKPLQEAVQRNRVASIIRSFVKQAHEAMAAQHFADAVQRLDEAEQVARAERVLTNHNVIYWMRAQAHLGLKQIAEAKQDAASYHALLDANSSPKDIEAGQHLMRLLAQAQHSLSIQPLLEKAHAAMEQGRFADALPLLNDAARKAPGNDVIFYLRSQAHVLLGHLNEARHDAKTVEDLAETDQDRAAVKRLRDMIAQAETGAQIRSWLDTARKAMEQGRFSSALEPLDQAARRAPEVNAIYFLRAQARMGSGDTIGALQDVQKFSELAESAEDKRAAERLRNALWSAGH